MNLQTLSVSTAVAFLAGLVQTYFLLLCWAYLGAHSPLLHWLLSLGLHGTTLRIIVLPIDFLTYVVLSLPAAFVLVMLRPTKVWLYLAVAVVPSFIWLNLEVVSSPYFFQFFGSFALSWLTQLCALPIAAWLAHSICKPWKPNHSSKQTRIPRTA